MRERTHSCGLRDARGVAFALRESQRCGVEGPWSLWSDYSSCSSTCGGVMKRARQHDCSNAIENDVQSCGNEGFWFEWSEWSGCSASCVGGTQYRRRGHSCSTEVDIESRSCGNPGDYGLWSAWSQCNGSNGSLAVCGGGLRRRSREGFCGNMDEFQDVECNTQRCCYNNPRTDWSPCSTTCGTGYPERVIADCDCLVFQIDRQRCTNAVILTEWSEWGAYSAE